MKSLALYIDKWYIVGAVNTDGITRLVNLPNHEDRIWLYFYEDVANDEISYGKGFQSKYRNNENHYYGDVFNSITSLSTGYTMFKLHQPMKGIFKSSKIFDDLRKDIEVEGDIETYVSFSKDISLASRLIFLEELRSDGFIVKESVAGIEHLALEYAAKKNDFAEDGYYLVLNASNENLHYSLYQKTEDFFVRESEDKLTGMGTDVRSRAIIEHVVDNINDREHFLKTPEEREAEYLRMDQYVDEWLIKLNACKSFIPVQITDVTFSRDPYKSYSVSVRKPKIDERTEKIVRDIIKVIARFVRESGVGHEQICGILFLGNTFINNQFKKELTGYYNVESSKLVIYRDSELSSLVNAYTYIPVSTFEKETAEFFKKAEEELEEIRREEENPKNPDTPPAPPTSDISRKFNEAMDLANEAKRNGAWEKMEEYVEIALTYKPKDPEALQLIDEAHKKKVEDELIRKQYKAKIQQAKSAYDEADYETAKFKADEALSLMPESKEAQSIKGDSQRRIKSQKDLERFLDRADLFIAQKAYSEASQELQKARLLDVDDKEIVEREGRIAKEQNAANAQVAELSNNLNTALGEGRYDDALKFCNELIEFDYTNSRRWSAKLAEINNKKERATEEQKRWDKLIRDIDSALLSEDWVKLNELCKEALAIRENSDIRSKLDKSESKLAEIRKNEQFTKTMSEINELAIKKEFDEANAKLNSLERSLKRDGLLDAAKENQIRETRRSLFDFGQSNSSDSPESGDSGNSAGRTRVTGFSNGEQPKRKPASQPKKPASTPDFDWDFGTPQKPKQPTSRPAQPSQPKQPKFFDSTPEDKGQQKKSSNPSGKITNDDFNF